MFIYFSLFLNIFYFTDVNPLLERRNPHIKTNEPKVISFGSFFCIIFFRI